VRDLIPFRSKAKEKEKEKGTGRTELTAAAVAASASVTVGTMTTTSIMLKWAVVARNAYAYKPVLVIEIYFHFLKMTS
jgi:hypothetical protein